MERHIDLPLTEEIAKTLHMGDNVYLNGVIYTARDAAHERMTDQLAEGIPIPFDTTDATIYYVGPTPAKPGQVIGSAGPTTSSRMDPYTPELIGLGMQGMIGKGRRNKEVIDAVRKYKAVYFVTVGGAGALLSECIVDRTEIAFSDLLSEAVTKLTVRDLPCFVGIDCEGNDIYDMQEQ